MLPMAGGRLKGLERAREAEKGQLMPGSLELAYLGDAVFEFYVRESLVRKGGRMKTLHRAAVDKVCAHAQAGHLEKIAPLLTEEEEAVVRRARNAKQTPPRNADRAEYHLATGFEALIGYLYYNGRGQRLNQLMTIVLNAQEEAQCPR